MDYLLYTYIAVAIALLFFLLFVFLIFRKNKYPNEDIAQLHQKIDGLEKKVIQLKKSDALSLKGVTISRFTPFADSIEGYGYCLGTLNQAGDGFIITSVTGRDGSRVFIKEIVSGSARVSISPEEEKIIQEAWKKSKNG